MILRQCSFQLATMCRFLELFIQDRLGISRLTCGCFLVTKIRFLDHSKFIDEEDFDEGEEFDRDVSF